MHGVASGDPLHDRVIIWTRISGIHDSEEVTVSWSIASDEAMTETIASASTTTSANDDWTVHVDVTGLEAASHYWYRFEVSDVASPVGRTRTARAQGDDEEIRLGLVSCAALPGGYFHAYRYIARREVDLVVHLGDYIYESYSEVHRTHDAKGPAVTLEDYRARYRQYRSDPDLQFLHQRHPMAAIWDDHEIAGNAWSEGASSHRSATEGSWQQRREAAMQAYFEWLPVRRPDQTNAKRVWRSLPLGGVADLVLIDTRHDGRDEQVNDKNPDIAAALVSPQRSMMSGAQRDWLISRLTTSKATWQLVANQVLFSPFGISLPGPLASLGDRFGVVVDDIAYNPDSWDGYQAERDRILDAITEMGVRNTVFVTGDVHSSWAFEVPATLGTDNPAAVELVVPAVSSKPFGSLVSGQDDVIGEYLNEGNLINELVTTAIESQLPHLRWSEVASNGYVVVAISKERLWAEWWHCEGVGPDDKGERRAGSWQVDTGSSRLAPARPSDAPDPRGEDSGIDESDKANNEDALESPSPITLGVVGTSVATATAAAIRIRRRRNVSSTGQDPPTSI